MQAADRRLLERIGEGIPLTGRPFRDIGEALGMGECEVIGRVRRLMDEGVIRRFGARIDHRKIGFSANAMACWNVPEPDLDRVGRILAAHPAITHCYERGTVPGAWEFNLYTVIHGHSREEVTRALAGLAGRTGVSEYATLFSTRRFKHVPSAHAAPGRRPP
jgi:DNA-binding Lrp family transcriptional regulator